MILKSQEHKKTNNVNFMISKITRKQIEDNKNKYKTIIEENEKEIITINFTALQKSIMLSINNFELLLFYLGLDCKKSNLHYVYQYINDRLTKDNYPILNKEIAIAIIKSIDKYHKKFPESHSYKMPKLIQLLERLSSDNIKILLKLSKYIEEIKSKKIITD